MDAAGTETNATEILTAPGVKSANLEGASQTPSGATEIPNAKETKGAFQVAANQITTTNATETQTAD